MKTNLFTLILILFLLQIFNAGVSNSQVGEIWTQRYNGPMDSTEFLNSMTVDQAGNVYVTGGSIGSGGAYLDIVTIKYNNNGSVQWLQRYNGPGDSTDIGNSIVVDGSGNVYITGESYGVGTKSDIVTIKYNSAGVQQWLQRYNGPENMLDEGRQISLDASGNLLVSGVTLTNPTSYDFIILKYNSSGMQQWLKTYNGTGSSPDSPSDLKTDASGNIYITGYSTGVGTGYDWLTIKYDPSGTQLWEKRYNGPGNLTDVANSLAVDASGNIYVTGFAGGNGTGNDITTIKYNSSGVEQWVQTYNGPGNGNDNARSLVLDAAGNVYITGYSNGGASGDDVCTIKYNSAGTEQWVKRYNGTANNDDYGNSIQIDNAGNSYVTCAVTNAASDLDYMTMKLDPSGNTLWSTFYNGSGNAADFPSSNAIDAAGNIYVTGYITGSGTESDYCTIKYNNSGVQQWAAIYDGPDGWDEAWNVILDNAGNVYVTGNSAGTGTGDDYCTIKYN
ncbi:MAG TPA: SBBP repeat-containing protein, partial [Ignavibacteria bacterium]|nr:SBBP repeat-containing protein [Ignavibacteria bacterium]